MPGIQRIPVEDESLVKIRSIRLIKILTQRLCILQQGLGVCACVQEQAEQKEENWSHDRFG
jgi:hypothetical protein